MINPNDVQAKLGVIQQDIKSRMGDGDADTGKLFTLKRNGETFDAIAVNSHWAFILRRPKQSSNLDYYLENLKANEKEPPYEIRAYV